MGKLQLNINNQGKITLTQKDADNAIQFMSEYPDGKSTRLESIRTIAPQDMVMMLNHYPYCQESNWTCFTFHISRFGFLLEIQITCS